MKHFTLDSKTIIPAAQRALQSSYAINPCPMDVLQGGWSAFALKVLSPGGVYFLKVYPKAVASTARWTQHMDAYLTVLAYLHRNTELQGGIAHPRSALDGRFRCEDENHIFVLFDYIDGQTVGDQVLQPGQITELAEIVAILHNVDAELPICAALNREDYNPDYCRALEHFLRHDLTAAADDLRHILTPARDKLLGFIEQTFLLAEKLRRAGLKEVLCHIDLHGYNLMQGRRLVLIDWEGLKLAPPEQDFIFFAQKPWFPHFLQVYRQRHPGFTPHREALAFYFLCRKLDDIWASIQSLLDDELTPAARADILWYLEPECISNEFFPTIAL